jgi:HTH-type transcriptional regulator/antitoxin HigA
MGPIRPIRSEHDYRAALREVERLMDATPGTPQFDRLEVLATLVDVYEREHHPVPPPTPLAAIKFRMEQMGLTRRDLTERVFGTSGRTAEILGGRRELTKEMIRKLVRLLDIPAGVLLGVEPRRSEKRARPRSNRTRAAHSA